MRIVIPTTDEFQQLIDALTTRERMELDDSLSELVRRFRAGEQLNIADVQPFVELCDKAFEADAEASRKLLPFQWLSNQRGLEEAFKSMRRAEKRRARQTSSTDWTFASRARRYLETPSREAVIQSFDAERMQYFVRMGHLDREIQYRQSRDHRASDLERLLKRRRDRGAYPALRTIAIGFRDYFHSDRPAELRELRTTLDHLDKAANELRRMLDEAISRPSTSALQLMDAFCLAHRNTDRVTHPIKRELFRLERAMQVAARNDAQAKERMLVHDLHFGLRRDGRRPGAAALAEFLTCDGVVNRLDTRTIERLLAKWKARETGTKVHPN